MFLLKTNCQPASIIKFEKQNKTAMIQLDRVFITLSVQNA